MTNPYDEKELSPSLPFERNKTCYSLLPDENLNVHNIRAEGKDTRKLVFAKCLNSTQGDWELILISQTATQSTVEKKSSSPVLKE